MEELVPEYVFLMMDDNDSNIARGGDGVGWRRAGGREGRREGEGEVTGRLKDDDNDH